MDRDLMEARVRDARVGRLATVTSNSKPHIVPCCFALDMHTRRIVTAVDGKPKSTTALRRLDNIRANPAVSLLVDHYDDDWTQLWWVRVDGTAHIVGEGGEYDAAIDVLTMKYDQYQRQRPTNAVIVIDTLTWRAWP